LAGLTDAGPRSTSSEHQAALVSSRLSILYGGRAQRSIVKGVLVNPWLQTGLSLVAGLLTAGGALLGVRLSARRNNRAKRWWRRFTWAAELTLDNLSAKRVTGLKVLTTLAQSDLAQRDEYLLLDVFHERVLDELLRNLPDLICRDVGSRLTEEQIAAVQLRLVLDEKLDRQTPEVVQYIAAEAVQYGVALADNGTVEQKPAGPSEMVRYEVADYRLRTPGGHTVQHARPVEIIATGHDGGAATSLSHPGLPTLGNVPQPPRFGRTTQQTQPGKVIAAGHDREAATPTGPA
jgi:hypothetical protein